MPPPARYWCWICPVRRWVPVDVGNVVDRPGRLRLAMEALWGHYRATHAVGAR